MKPVIAVIRRELRLGDNPLLAQVAEMGRPVIPVFILDEVFETYGAAPLWRLGLGAERFGQSLAEIGSRLVFRRGAALDVLRDLIKETGADVVRWGRAYDPDQVARDKALKEALVSDGIDAASVSCHLIYEPWSVKTKMGGFFKVYSPFWRAVEGRDIGTPAARITALMPPEVWPDGEDPADWNLGAAMDRGLNIVRPYLCVGEEAALDRLETFVDQRVQDYQARRDFPGEAATSGLSENLAWGEISARVAFLAGARAHDEGAAGAYHFMKELAWREFAYHLVWHTPQIISDNWRAEWDAFPWSMDGDSDHAMAWKQGRTGIRFVDAAMREMYVTGIMHNRARMNVASYLCKHLMTHWRVGLAWFEDCLIDWDPASNAMGWQWAAGSGPDAAPYFRVFNPVTQIDKFDGAGRYQEQWIAEGQQNPSATALSYFDAVPRSWGLQADAVYPDAIVTAADGRKRALEAYSARSF
ncbi:MAG: deoxyribodipyrimidine photo-lyase [Pseudomonadota bacterium]